MNLTTAIFLVNRDVRGIAVKFGHNMDTTQDIRTAYTYKSLDQTIKKDDLVIVPSGTGHKFTIARVSDVDVDIDYESSIQYKWIAGKFDPQPYEDLLKKEEKVIEVVRKAEFGRKRKELAAALKESVEGITTLELAKE